MLSRCAADVIGISRAGRPRPPLSRPTAYPGRPPVDRQRDVKSRTGARVGCNGKLAAAEPAGVMDLTADEWSLQSNGHTSRRRFFCAQRKNSFNESDSTLTYT
jgi:hypothetical protein